MNTPIRVLVVDDSSVARTVIARSLAPFKQIEIVGMAADPYAAREQILALNPDVVTLDIEMPRMDGITFLKLIMKHRPMPVIIMSSLTQAGLAKAMEALQAGAVDVLDKPSSYSASHDGTRLAQTIQAAACARVSAGGDNGNPPQSPVRSSFTGSRAPRSFPSRKIILIGASTGGTEAIKAILTTLPDDLPGICIVQHIPAYFSKAFADRLNQVCSLGVREAQAGDVVAPGTALVAPGGYHMLIKWDGNRYRVDLNQGPPVHFQRPSVDILFDSAVRAGAGPHAIAALLTGMGADGANGLLHLREAGAATVAQSEESCVVFGMPREAIRLGAAQRVLALNQIGGGLDQMASGRSEPRGSPRDAASHLAVNSVNH